MLSNGIAEIKAVVLHQRYREMYKQVRLFQRKQLVQVIENVHMD